MSNAGRADVMRCDALLDAPVVDAAGDPVGTLACVMLDLACGRVAYAVLAHGGVLGLGERHFAIPWQRLAHDAANARFTLDVPRHGLAEAFPVAVLTDL